MNDWEARNMMSKPLSQVTWDNMAECTLPAGC
jgi:hypothetical protein